MYPASLPRRCFVSADEWNSFASVKTLAQREDLCFGLSSRYAIPRVFWTPLCRNSNGFFGCENLYNVDGNVEGHSIVPLW